MKKSWVCCPNYKQHKKFTLVEFLLRIFVSNFLKNAQLGCLYPHAAGRQEWVFKKAWSENIFWRKR